MLDRRNFLKLAACLSAAFGVAGLPEPVRAALKKIAPDKVPTLVIYKGWPVPAVPSPCCRPNHQAR